MNKLYDRIYWHNNTTPALNESNLNSMSKAIDDIDDRVIQLADDWVDVVGEVTELRDECEQFRDEAAQSASNASASATQASGYASDASGYATTAHTEADRAEYYADQAEAVIEHATEGAEAWAVGERGGVPVSPSDETYHNNSKWYSNQSGASATQAQRSAQDCEDIKEEVLDMLGVASFTVDFATGELIYTMDNVFSFSINTTTGNLEWEVVA